MNKQVKGLEKKHAGQTAGGNYKTMASYQQCRCYFQFGAKGTGGS